MISGLFFLFLMSVRCNLRIVYFESNDRVKVHHEICSFCRATVCLMPPTWNAFCPMGYLAPFFVKLNGGLSSAKDAGAVDRHGLEEMLRRLEAVDLDSVSKVSDSKVQSA